MILNSRHSFYCSDVWAMCKKEVYERKKNEYGVVCCEMCGKPLQKSFNPKAKDNRSSIIYHHTIELTDNNYMDYSISANPELIKILCFKCHNDVHNRFQGGTQRKKIYLVVGAVCSGKTTFVKENMKQGDLVLDLDKIWEALSFQPVHIKPNQIKPIIFAVRDTILEQIKMRAGTWQTAWITTTQSRPMELKRMADSLDAEIVTMDTDKNTCLDRLYLNPDGRDIEFYTQLIQEYFNNVS